jgi:hypothetical protein
VTGSEDEFFLPYGKPSTENIKALLRRGRGYRDMNYLLLKAQRLAVTKTNSSFFIKPHRMRTSSDSCSDQNIDE